ncbi:Arc family DNA-binding protein [Pseudomonas versuta]|uniref:Arc family DNA-binding protein n=1 Tax=Pseudomonas versuta TaxID=1788301 RepID=UPI000B1EA324|nr:Arc family DNA-binding protein [Pseudomonas versuta]
MAEKVRVSSFPLRLQEGIRGEVHSHASKNRRSLNAELGILIEEGLRWRATQGKQAVA